MHGGREGELRGCYGGKRALITGGHGFIGSSLAWELAGAGCRVVILDQCLDPSWRPEVLPGQIESVAGDIALRKTWEALLPGMDVVFHLAAVEYRALGYHPARDLRVNTRAVLQLLETCCRRGLRPRIVFSSSANLFGTGATVPIGEAYGDQPLALWSVHKLMAEQYLRVYARRYGIDAVILRLANVYGPTAAPGALFRVVLNRVVAAALAGKGLSLYANRHCRRDYVFSRDVVRAFLEAGRLASAAPEVEMFVIGSGEGRTFTDIWSLIARQVEGITGRPVPLAVDERQEIEPLDFRNFIADTTAFRRRTGWAPATFLEEGIAEVIETIRSSGRQEMK
jgi:UDP-glucose 4-epimerase